MPITKQVIKRVKQARKKAQRNQHYRSDMKSMIKLILGYVEKKETDKALKIQPKVIKAIDMAAKKKIIHVKNAAHKKSRIQRAINSFQGASKTAKAPKKSDSAKAPAAAEAKAGKSSEPEKAEKSPQSGTPTAGKEEAKA